MIDVVTFEVGDTTIQMVDGRVLFWSGDIKHDADIDLDMQDLQNALSTAHMLRKID